MTGIDAFLAARDFLLKHREDYEAAYRDFTWPALDRFNWAIEWFDRYARGNHRTALHIVEGASEIRLSYQELSERSSRVALFLRRQGVARGDRILMMLPNCVPIWEVMLAAMKLGAVVIPATQLLTPDDLRDRFERGNVKHVVTDPAGAEKLRTIEGAYTRLVVSDAPVQGWRRYQDAYSETGAFAPDGETRADDPMLLYFTSGTTAKPKLVLHTHASYPVGHLSTMYWIGIREGDVHLNISSPGWAKHAWSCFFAPLNAGATVFVHNYARFHAGETLGMVARHAVTTMCAPPTVWRLIILEDLAKHPVKLREALSAGEPLNPEVIDRVKQAWGITIRDGYGQTETTCQVGNSPGQPIKPGSRGRPMPGYRIALLSPNGGEAEEGEISLSLSPRPMALMAGYLGDESLTGRATRGGYYRTGDVATRDKDGYITYVGRADDVFKSSDYRISPFELESALLEHEAIAETAIVPSPDPVRGLVPKAVIVLKPGETPSRDMAASIFRFVRQRLAPYKRIRRIEFGELPKTISGKIRRVELREREAGHAQGARAPHEYWQEDFPEIT